jgi:hypothetical protein
VRNVTFYHKETGILHPVTVVTNSDMAVALNTPADHVAIDHPEGGRLDHLSQRVEVTTGNLVDYQPPPSPDQEWRAQFVAARISGARRAELVNQQHSLVRRLALNPSDASARSALEAIDAECHLLSENTSP